MRRTLMVLVASLATLAVAAPGALAAATKTYTGQGMDGSGPTAQKCSNPDNGGTGMPIPADGRYLLWVLNGSVTGPVKLYLPGNTSVDMVKVGSTWKAVTPVFSRADLVAYPARAEFAGGSANNLVVSHGCAAVGSFISTTIHQGLGDTPAHPVIGALPLGSSVHDSATVTVEGGVPIPANSSVTFTFTGGATATLPVLADGKVDLALPQSALHAGSYKYTAKFTSGNTNFVKNSTSEDEPLQISKAQLEITTEIHDASHEPVGGDEHVDLGSVVHDTATVTGQVPGFDTGAVAFTLNGSGVGRADDATDPIRTVDSAALAAGDYHYAASVAGNSDYFGDDSPDEPLTVDRAKLEITTTIHDKDHGDVGSGPVPLGSVVHDTAAVTGKVGEFDLPAISFTLNGEDVGNDDAADTPATARSVDSGPLHAGVYAYNATVDSNSNYIGETSVDEPLKVDKGTLKITTEIHNVDGDAPIADGGSVPLGTKTHDTAQVSGAVDGIPAPSTDDLEFTLNGADAGRNDGTGPDAIRSEDSAALAAGDYTYVATLKGSDDYEDATSPDEPFHVSKAKLSIVTQIHDADHNAVGGEDHVKLGSVVHDTATVGGAVAGFPIPDVRFTLDGTPQDNGTAADNGSTAHSVDSLPLHAGSYTYKATVGDDSNYEGSTSEDEPLTVDQAELHITTTIHDKDHNAVVKVNTGTVVHDTATVTGQVPGFAIGAISFTLNGNTVANGAAEAGVTARSADSAPLTAGNYTYKAVVAGNGDYIGDTSADEPLEVTGIARFCSPGFWRNADDAAWLRTGISRTDPFNDTVVAAGFYADTLAGDPTLAEVLAPGAGLGGPAAPFGITAFNAVGAFLTSQIPGYVWDGQTDVDTCPLDNHGNFKKP